MRPVGRPGNYIFLPPRSSIYHIRFQYPATKFCQKAKKVVRSLGTSDYREAQRKSQYFIDLHLLELASRKEAADANVKRAQVTIPRRLYNFGSTILEDGRCVIVTRENPAKAMIVDEHGRSKPIDNEVHEPVPGYTLSEAEYWSAVMADDLMVEDPDTGEMLDASCPEWEKKGKAKKEFPEKVPKRHANDLDLDLFDMWVKQQSVTPHVEREARAVFETFKIITGGKRFNQCTYTDAVALADHLFETNRWPTVNKKIGHLRAVVNFAYRRQLFEGQNPFASVMRKKRHDDIRKRGVFDDADMKLVRELGPEVFSKNEWLLWVLLATTGMRLNEAISIESERVEKGIRYIEIGKGKTLQSQRRVPLPEGVLPLLPSKITAPLFPGETAPKMSKRMNRRLDAIGITDAAKVIHSLRHRAKDRLRTEGVKLEYQFELLGHEKKTAADGYGHGSAMTTLRPLIDKIGY